MKPLKYFCRAIPPQPFLNPWASLIDYDEARQRLNPDMVVLGDRFETFWSDYMFEISEGEFSDLRSKFPTAKFAKTRDLPKAFTEKALYLIATIRQ